MVSSNKSLLFKSWKCHVIRKNLSVIICVCTIIFFFLMSILNTRHRPCHPYLVQYLTLRHLSCYTEWKISSRSLMSVNMFCEIPINYLYGRLVTDNVWSTIKYSTPHLGSIVFSVWMLVYATITMRITYATLHNILCSILIAGESNINIIPNIHTYVKTS